METLLLMLIIQYEIYYVFASSFYFEIPKFT